MTDLKRLSALLVCAAALFVLGCDSDDDDTDTSTANDMATTSTDDMTSTTSDDMTSTTSDDVTSTTSDDMTTATTDDMTTTTDDATDMADTTTTFPPSPTLGTQIDRAGRAAISTALIGRFEDQTTGGPKRDQYNEGGRAVWGDFIPEIMAGLAIYDSLDTVCGNQLIADGLDGTADVRYSTLAGLLSTDYLIVDTTQAACPAYFGAEAQLLGLDAGCGGRTPLHDTIDVTYSAVAVGALEGVGDGVDADDVTHSVTDFPYLAAP